MSILKLLGSSMALFLYGMTLLSESLQKVAGEKLRGFLSSMTSNSFKRVLTGLTITAAIQSSAATTLMVVSFVNAGLLTLAQSIGMIMGANIGTTVSAWLLALLGFSGSITSFTIPLIAVGFVLKMFKGKKRKSVGDLIIGFAVMFLGLSMVQSSVDPSFLEYVKNSINGFSDFGFWGILLCVLIGSVLTMILQSSAAMMALTLVMVNSGLNFELGAALVLGENIGTTLTANLAASVANTSARRAALGHSVFNLFGVFWVLVLYRPFLWVVSHLVVLLGFDNPMEGATGLSVLCSIAMVHSLFNVSNTLILIGFTNQIVKFVTRMIPGKPQDEVFKLQYIQHGPLSTAELSLSQAKGEILHLVDICHKQFEIAREALGVSDEVAFEELNAQLDNYEKVTDNIEFEIGKYLNDVADGDISDISSRRIQAMFKVIGELESIGDSGQNIGNILQRSFTHHSTLDSAMTAKVRSMLGLIFQGFDAMKKNLELGYENLVDISNAQDIEQEINEYRNNLKEEHLDNLENHSYNYASGSFFMDLINECEKVGDYMINVSEAILEIK